MVENTCFNDLADPLALQTRTSIHSVIGETELFLDRH